MKHRGKSVSLFELSHFDKARNQIRKYSAMLFLLMVFLSACKNGEDLEPDTGSGCDCPRTVADIDGNQYDVVKIGCQCWMAENLKTSRYRNGDIIPNVTTNEEWTNLTTGAWSTYENSIQHEEIYGKLYNWYAVADERTIAPVGWHVATEDEWRELADTLGGHEVAGGLLKALHLWDTPNLYATNSSGFSALPGGFRYTAGYFSALNNSGWWWSSSGSIPGRYAMQLALYAYEKPLYFFSMSIQEGSAIRCVMD